MFATFCFIVGFVFAYTSMIAMYNYLRGENGESLKFIDHYLITLVSLISGMAFTMIVFY